MKVTVISQRGKLVGVWLPPAEAADPNAPICRPVGGPGQKLHDLEVAEVAVDRSRATELAKLVKKKLKLT
ncbi:MAG: hypothetical protein EHM78_24495 [Myxococcaceae bacterium]|nr:MAG: hypothetical protein EHM78_24495 [Myxococcaceae bacterium]